MSNADFKVGDVVELKSGSIPMMVQEAEATLGTIVLVWMDGAKRCEGNFAPEILQRVQKRGDGDGPRVVR